MAEVAVLDDDAPGTDLVEPSAADKIATPLPWREAPVIRQVLVLVALAVAISIGVAVALWSKDPNYTPLFSDLGHEDAVKVTDALKAGDIPFRIDENTGAVLVQNSRVRELRMRLASQGLPESSSVGLEILQQKQDLSTSQFVESARYNHALETELARSISTIKSIKTARVHLALPKQSIFVRKRVNPSASVVVSLHPGRMLESGQVASIVHLVSSSIANMEASQVTVVDQYGRMLTDPQNNPDIAVNGKQFEYRRALERDYSERIVNLLEPIVGYGKVRAQVTAELNFTQIESTQEIYDPDEKDQRRMMRSEQVSEEENSVDFAAGVPGALTNQPPGEGTTDAESAAPNADGSPKSRRSAATRNYELDRVISHKRSSSGDIERLAVAVIIDDKVVTFTPDAVKPEEVIGDPIDGVAQSEDEEAEEEAAENGESASTETATETEAAAETPPAPATPTTKREPYTEAELARLNALVKEVIGFDAARGDTINLMNSSFFEPEVTPIPELPLWEQIWVQDLIKQVLGGIFILLLLLLIVRPIVRGLIPASEDPDEEDEEGDEDEDEDDEEDDESLEGEIQEPEIVWGEDGRPIDPAADTSKMQFDKKLHYARILVLEDPARAATVMKVWMNETDEELDAA